MKLNVEFNYVTYHVPKRCRKPRLTQFVGTATIEIRECAARDAMWAGIVCSKDGRREKYCALRHYDERFYRRAMTDVDMRTKIKRSYSEGTYVEECYVRTEQKRGMTVEELAGRVMDECRRDVPLYYNQEVTEQKRIDALNAMVERYLIVNGELWEACGEPMYHLDSYTGRYNKHYALVSVSYEGDATTCDKRAFNANDMPGVMRGVREIEESLREAGWPCGATFNQTAHIVVVRPECFAIVPELNRRMRDTFMRAENERILEAVRRALSEDPSDHYVYGTTDGGTEWRVEIRADYGEWA